jgi:hypothetical protein
MEILSKLFGSNVRVKIMRLFILNTDTVFDIKMLASKARVPKTSLRKDLNVLVSIGFVKRKSSKGKLIGFVFNQEFPFISPIKELLLNPEFMKKDEIANRFKQVGKVKLLAVSGIFIENKQSRLDILLVADKIKRPVFDQIIKNLEAELGKELAYALFTPDEFFYRLDMYDKLLSDMFDFPHEKLIATPEFSTFTLKKT